VARVEADGRITFINDRAVQLAGYSLEDIPTLDIWRQRAFPDPAYRLAVTSRWDAAVLHAAGRGDGDIEPLLIRLATRSGEARDATVFGVAGRDGFLALFIDNTERNRSEARRLRSEQRFRDIVNAAGEYVWECDADYRYTWLSDKVRDIVGYSPEEMIGRRPTDFMPADEHDSVRRSMDASREPDGTFRGFGHRSIRRSGEELWQLGTGVVVRDERRAVIAHRGTGRDITLRKKAEGDRDRLEAQVHEAQKLQALGTLAGAVAHEFDNLLAVILGHTALARGDNGLGDATRATSSRSCWRSAGSSRAGDARPAGAGDGVAARREFRRAGDAAPRAAARRAPCLHRRDRRGRRHGRRDAAANLRAVLHDQAARPGHGPRAVGRGRHRAQRRRRGAGAERARARLDLPRVPAAVGALAACRAVAVQTGTIAGS
jgi:PAS domain S-box-containing protein